MSQPRQRPYMAVDVFTAQPYRGAPLAVVLDGEDLGDAQMQDFARWTNLPETTFLLPPTPAGRAQGADYRVRIFTPVGELPFAGHPTLGTARACRGRYRGPRGGQRRRRLGGPRAASRRCHENRPRSCSAVRRADRSHTLRMRTQFTAWFSPLRRIAVARPRVGLMFSSRFGPLMVSQKVPAVLSASASDISA